MSSMRIAYPPPPPTSNALTTQQRTQLLRTTKKLGRVLGSTPQFIEGSTSPIHVHSPSDDSEDETYSPYRQSTVKPLPHLPRSYHHGYSSSISSISSCSSTASHSSVGSTYSASSSRSAAPSKAGSDTSDSWPSRRRSSRRPPLLRLALSAPAEGPPSTTAAVKPSLDTIPGSPGSPLFYKSHSPSSSTSSNSPLDEVHTLMLPRIYERDSLCEPDFQIPSESSLRCAKMDRLRRKLGDGVPIELVFPSDAQKSHSESSPPTIYSPAGIDRQTVVVHRSRQCMTSNHSHSRSRSLSRSPSTSSSAATSPLCAIIESPGEHGGRGGCYEQFGNAPDSQNSIPRLKRSPKLESLRI